MSTTLPSPSSLPRADTIPPLHRFTVEEYIQLSQIGVVHADDNLELIEGVIVEKMTQNPPHASCITRLTSLLARQLDPERFVVRVQTVLRLQDSLPEPDFVIAVGPVTRYDQQHPTPAEAVLVIEVSDETLLYDRRTRGRMYARAGVTNYWIVNLIERQLERHKDPDTDAAQPAYRQREVSKESDTASLSLDEQTSITFRVDDILAPKTA